MKKRTILDSFLITILMLAVFFSPAYAAKPSVEKIEFFETFPVECDGFDAVFADNVTGQITTYFDQEGNPDRFILHLHFKGTITHSETGQSFRDQSSITVYGDISTGTTAETGVFLHLNIPGEGVVAFGAGRIVRDESGNVTFASGPHTELFSQEGLALVCEGLANL